jgi:hypothetical protein
MAREAHRACILNLDAMAGLVPAIAVFGLMRGNPPVTGAGRRVFGGNYSLSGLSKESST